MRFLPIAFLLLASSVLAQTTWFVDATSTGCPGTGTASDPFCSIQAAIDASATGDTVLVQSGTYVENLRLDSSKSIVVESAAGPERTIIDGGNVAPAVDFAGSPFQKVTSELIGFTVTNGYSSRLGGGIRITRGAPRIQNTTVTGNVAHLGGAVAAYDGSSPTIVNSRFLGNQSYGAIRVDSSSIELINSTVTGEDVGVVATYFGSARIVNSTITGNGRGVVAGYHDTAIEITNSIVWGNSSSNVDAGDPSSSVTAQFSNIGGGHIGIGNIDADPRFLDAAHGDFRLACISPCVDAGTSAVGVGLPATDIEGDDRFVDGRSTGLAVPDMGSDEFDMLWVVEQPASGRYGFTAMAPPAQTGNAALLLLSFGNAAGTSGMPVPVSGGQRLFLDNDSLFNLWMGFVSTPAGQVSLDCPGKSTAPISSIPGFEVFYAGLSINLATGQIPSVTPTHSYLTQ